MTAYAGTIRDEDWINPVDGVITSSYGTRSNPVNKKDEVHDGLDIAVALRTGVAAVKSGTVIETKKSASYGNMLIYETNDGYTVIYAHLEEVLAKAGQKIKQGEIVALSGNTGLSTGPHLHYTLISGGKKIDPIITVNLPYTSEVLAEYATRGESLPILQSLSKKPVK